MLSFDGNSFTPGAHPYLQRALHKPTVNRSGLWRIWILAISPRVYKDRQTVSPEEWFGPTDLSAASGEGGVRHVRFLRLLSVFCFIYGFSLCFHMTQSFVCVLLQCLRFFVVVCFFIKRSIVSQSCACAQLLYRLLFLLLPSFICKTTMTKLDEKWRKTTNSPTTSPWHDVLSAALSRTNEVTLKGKNNYWRTCARSRLKPKGRKENYESE